MKVCFQMDSGLNSFSPLKITRFKYLMRVPTPGLLNLFHDGFLKEQKMGYFPFLNLSSSDILIELQENLYFKQTTK